jgi:hypothetical protein
MGGLAGRATIDVLRRAGRPDRCGPLASGCIRACPSRSGSCPGGAGATTSNNPTSISTPCPACNRSAKADSGSGSLETSRKPASAACGRWVCLSICLARPNVGASRSRRPSSSGAGGRSAIACDLLCWRPSGERHQASTRRRPEAGFHKTRPMGYPARRQRRNPSRRSANYDAIGTAGGLAGL